MDLDESNTTFSQFRDSEMPAGSLMAQSDTPDIQDKDKEEDFSSTKAINDGEKDDTDDLKIQMIMKVMHQYLIVIIIWTWKVNNHILKITIQIHNQIIKVQTI